MASAAYISYSDVQIGAWTDKSTGAIKGANITVTSTNGVILVAFLALFIQYAGQHLWGIASFAWHQVRVSHRPKTALQFQQTAALRNNASPGQTLWYFAQIAWAWRHTFSQRRGWWWMAALPVFVPLLFQCLLTATGILSSTIVATSDVDILLRGDSCGIWQTPSQDTILAADNEFMVENQRWIGNVNEFSRIYARACYNGSQSADSPSCQAFTQRSIPYASQLNASCPFDNSTCSFPEGNLQMDTGEMDTNDMLGINTAKENIKFRKVTTCAPLKPDIYTKTVNETGMNGEPGYHVYWMWGVLDWYDNYDYIAEAQNYSGLPFAGYTMITPRHYLMDSRLNFPDQSSFEPRQQFNVSDGDTFMLFLSAHDMVFSAPCDDPWISAHHVGNTAYNRTIYRADYLMSPVGCVEQFTFCNPHKKDSPCTSLGGILPAAADAKADLGLSASQSAIVDIIVNAIYAGNMNIVQPVFMLADNTAMDGVQLPLPGNQWVIELQDMHNRALTGIQRMVVDYARGPGSTAAKQFLEVPNAAFKSLCNMVRAKTNAQFSNVNTYGLAVTLSLGTLIILTNLLLVDIVAAIQKRRNIDPIKRETWVADGLLQLHKDSLQLDDQGPWKNLEKPVPIIVQSGLVRRKAPQEQPAFSVVLTSPVDSNTSDFRQKDPEAAIETREIVEDRMETPRMPAPVPPVRMQQGEGDTSGRSSTSEVHQAPVSPLETSPPLPTLTHRDPSPKRGL